MLKDKKKTIESIEWMKKHLAEKFILLSFVNNGGSSGSSGAKRIVCQKENKTT